MLERLNNGGASSKAVGISKAAREGRRMVLLPAEGIWEAAVESIPLVGEYAERYETWFS